LKSNSCTGIASAAIFLDEILDNQTFLEIGCLLGWKIINQLFALAQTI